MLFVLTGKIQIGKSRWLERLTADLARRGTPSYGVVTPGIWVESAGPHADANGFEKLGIQAVLLPDGAQFPFALRRDLAEGDGNFDESSQSAQALLGWQISEVSLARVNGHFHSLDLDMSPGAAPGLLVVDEVGRLELANDGGLVEATRLLKEGPRPAWPHALVVARRSLAEPATERFGRRWGSTKLIAPDQAGRAAILDAFSQASPA